MLQLRLFVRASVCGVNEGVDGGYTPLPTRPQRYFDLLNIIYLSCMSSAHRLLALPLLRRRERILSGTRCWRTSGIRWTEEKTLDEGALSTEMSSMMTSTKLWVKRAVVVAAMKTSVPKASPKDATADMDSLLLLLLMTALLLLRWMR